MACQFLNKTFGSGNTEKGGRLERSALTPYLMASISISLFNVSFISSALTGEWQSSHGDERTFLYGGK